MIVLVWILAAVYGVFGIMMLVYPDGSRKWSAWFNTPARSAISALVGIALGINLWVGKLSTGLPMFVGFYAILAVVGSLIYLALPWRMMKRFNDWSIGLSDAWYRIFAFIALLFAVGFVLAAILPPVR